jgi:hypothetical protein
VFGLELFCSTTDPTLWSTECIGLCDHIMNVIAVGALERAEVETHACWHDVNLHHVSMALWAGTPLNLNVDMAGRRTDFWH